MIKVFQSLTVENDGQGDCLNACIASILELPLRNVGQIFPKDEGNWLERRRVWLADKGYRLIFHNTESPPKGYSLVTVYTDRLYPPDHKRAGLPIAHMCVAFNGVIVHDPYPIPTDTYEIKYYQELRLLTKAEKHLHEHNSREGRCIHGYRISCTVCPHQPSDG